MRGSAELPTIGWLSDPEHWLSIAEPVALFHRIGWLRHPGIFTRTCDEIRPGYHHIESCQETVPEALTAFMEGADFEEVVRTAVSLGGDCDTLTCIAASIAEAFYGLPDNMRGECRKRLPKDMLGILDRFDERRGDRK